MLKPLTRQDQYDQVDLLERRLRNIADDTPGWLYDESQLGGMIDDLNRARSEYEIRPRAPITYHVPTDFAPGGDGWPRDRDPISGRQKY